MTITFAKKSIVEKAPEIVEEGIVLSDFSSDIDEIGKLQAAYDKDYAKISKQVDKLADQSKAIKKREKELCGKLNEAYDEVGVNADDDGVELGAEYRAELTKKAMKRHIKDIQMVRKLMGDETFYQLASIALKDIDAYLNPKEIEKCVTVDRVDRSMKIVRRTDV